MERADMKPDASAADQRKGMGNRQCIKSLRHDNALNSGRLHQWGKGTFSRCLNFGKERSGARTEEIISGIVSDLGGDGRQKKGDACARKENGLELGKAKTAMGVMYRERVESRGSPITLAEILVINFGKEG